MFPHMYPQEPLEPKDFFLLQGVLTIIIAVLTLVAWVFCSDPALPEVLSGMTVFCAAITGVAYWDKRRQERKDALKNTRASDEN